MRKDVIKRVLIETASIFFWLRLVVNAINKNQFIGEIFHKVKLFAFLVKLLASRFASPYWEKTIKVFTNKFHSINFYQICHINKCNIIFWDQIPININMFKVKKIINSYKNHNQNNMFLSKTFFYYTIILIRLSDNIMFFLQLALYCFYLKIINLFNAYKKQEKILFLALNFHTYIFLNYLTDLIMWEISTKWKASVCNFLTVVFLGSTGARSKLKHPTFSHLTDENKNKNHFSIICYS